MGGRLNAHSQRKLHVATAERRSGEQYLDSFLLSFLSLQCAIITGIEEFTASVIILSYVDSLAGRWLKIHAIPSIFKSKY